MKNITLSVIICTHNNSDYIYEALNSLLKQCNTEIEVIIINDGSSDHSDEIIKGSIQKYNNLNIKYITQDNIGISLSRNKGIGLASGEYVSFLDGDDLLTDDCLSTILDIIKKEKPDLIDFKYIKFPGDDLTTVNESPFKHKTTVFSDIHHPHVKETFKLSHWHIWSRVFKKEILQGHSFPVQCRYEDMFFTPWLYFKSKKMVTTSKILYLYRDNPSGITRNPRDTDKDDMCNVLCHSIDQYQRFKHRRNTGELIFPMLVNNIKEIKIIHKKIDGFYSYSTETCALLRKASRVIPRNMMTLSSYLHLCFPEVKKIVSKAALSLKK